MTTQVDMSFDDAAFAVENAIVNQGLVIDYVSNIGEMLERTREDVGSDKVLFKDTKSYLFCSAVVSRAAMEADISNVANCPYSVFVYETDEGVTIGHRDYADRSMDEVEAMLSSIVEEAAAE